MNAPGTDSSSALGPVEPLPAAGRRRHARSRPGQEGAVLFLCVANSARSQMGEGWARILAGSHVKVMSAGSAPTRLHPLAVQVMAEVGIDISGQRSKSLADVEPGTVATVVTLCAEEACPVFPGPVRRLHWPLPDPAAASGSEAERLAAFRRVRDAIRDRVRELFTPAG